MKVATIFNMYITLFQKLHSYDECKTVPVEWYLLASVVQAPYVYNLVVKYVTLFFTTVTLSIKNILLELSIFIRKTFHKIVSVFLKQKMPIFYFNDSNI